MRNPIAWLLIFLIRIYQYTISPFIGPCCRFFPSCSSYTIDAINQFGIFKGSYLSVKRLLRCHPFHPGGVDFVPKKYSNRLLRVKQKPSRQKDTMAR